MSLGVEGEVLALAEMGGGDLDRRATTAKPVDQAVVAVLRTGVEFEDVPLEDDHRCELAENRGRPLAFLGR